MKMKLPGIPKALSLAENVLRVVKNHHVSVQSLINNFELIKRPTPCTDTISVQSIPL